MDRTIVLPYEPTTLPFFETGYLRLDPAALLLYIHICTWLLAGEIYLICTTTTTLCSRDLETVHDMTSHIDQLKQQWRAFEVPSLYYQRPPFRSRPGTGKRTRLPISAYIPCQVVSCLMHINLQAQGVPVSPVRWINMYME